ncbi:MAG: hypothetical protein ACR2PL_12870, partial [Dehalococcoidia bacterium]
MKSTAGLAGALIATFVLSVFVITGAVRAQTSSPSPKPQQSPAPSGSGQGKARDANHQATIEDFLNMLAQNLHIDRSTLDAAMKTTAKQQVDKQQAAGKLTQTQADQIKTRIDNGQFPGFGGGFEGFGPGKANGKGSCFANLPASLGISASDIKQGVQNGQSLQAILQSKGKTLQDLQ